MAYYSVKMTDNPKSKITLIFLWICLIPTIAISQKSPTILYSENDQGKTFTSLQDALIEPLNVYRLKLTKLPQTDSLPDELFQLTELRELTIKGCRLCRLNSDIQKLRHLRYLNLDKNKLLRLPAEIGKLSELSMLIVSRNILETFPDEICRLKKLSYIDAWGNPLYILPESISALNKSLNTLDLRQIPLTKTEYEKMVELLPHTEIIFTDICECENRRDHN